MTNLKIHLYNLLKHKPPLLQTTQIHAQIILNSLTKTNNLTGSLIQSYTSHKNLENAKKVFFLNQESLKNTFLCNIIIQSCLKTSFYDCPLLLFKQMVVLGGDNGGKYGPDDYTFTFIITACSRQKWLDGFGGSVHGMVVKVGFGGNVCVGNGLVSFYVSCGRTGCARKVFDEMGERDVVTWTSMVKGCVVSGDMVEAERVFGEMPERNEVSWAVMIGGYVGCAMYSDGLRCFNEMLCDGDGGGDVKVNEAILVSVLSACAHLGQLDQGKWVHFYIDRIRFPKSANVSTALIDMYAKCGKIEYAKEVFNRAERRDLLTWTSMISGLSMHGRGKEALKVFYEMLAKGIKPDSVTLIGVLTACSHSGQVNEGISFFNDMKRLWGISPKIEHFGCLIDLLSRAGRLEEAFKAVKTMQMEPDGVIWRALLSACRIHGNVGLAERIIEHVNKTGGGARLLLSNLHASFGQWDDVRRIRESKIHKEDDSAPGCSYIEIDGVVHEFLAADKLHPRIMEITLKLNEVMKRISLDGDYIQLDTELSFVPS